MELKDVFVVQAESEYKYWLVKETESAWLMYSASRDVGADYGTRRKEDIIQWLTDGCTWKMALPDTFKFVIEGDDEDYTATLTEDGEQYDVSWPDRSSPECLYAVDRMYQNIYVEPWGWKLVHVSQETEKPVKEEEAVKEVFEEVVLIEKDADGFYVVREFGQTFRCAESDNLGELVSIIQSLREFQ